MKKIRAFCLLFSIILAFQCFAPSALAAEANSVDQSVVSGCHSVDASSALSSGERLTKTANAVILYDLNSDTMLYTYQPDERIFPSSMVKLMTALVALENGQMTDMVEVTRTALSHVAIGSMSAGLKAGEVLSLGDLLYCMMTASANDAAAVIAEHVGGSQEGFLEMMNQKAADLGCKDTHYSNVHGLHDDDTYTTARDICRIMDNALENPAFKMLFSAKTHTVPATEKSKERKLKTTNSMMISGKYYDERVTGGRTGATDKAGRCLTITAEDKGMNVLCIVMGATPTMASDGSVKAFGSFEEAKILLDYAFKTYEYNQVFFDGQTIAQYPVKNGMNDVITQPEHSASTVLPADMDLTKLRWIYEKTTDTLEAPIKKGQILGSVQVWHEDKCLAQTNLVAMNDVPVWQEPKVPEDKKEASSGSRWKPFLIIIGIVAGGIVLFGLVLLTIRIIRISSVKAQHRRRRENRRRSR